MSIKFDVTMTQKIMYNFLLYHAYNNFSVILGNILGILVAGLGVNMWTEDPGKAVLNIVLGVAVIVYTPFSLYLSAKKQVKGSDVFKQPITYTISEDGLASSQNDVTTEAKWEAMVKVVSTGKSIIIYTGKNKATILPKEAMGNDYMAVVEMISTHVEPNKVKIKS